MRHCRQGATSAIRVIGGCNPFGYKSGTTVFPGNNRGIWGMERILVSPIVQHKLSCVVLMAHWGML